MGEPIDLGQPFAESGGHIEVHPVATLHVETKRSRLNRQVNVNVSVLVKMAMSGNILQTFNQHTDDPARDFALHACALNGLLAQGQQPREGRVIQKACVAHDHAIATRGDRLFPQMLLHFLQEG